MELIFLGTGHATVTKCYNTCFAIKNGSDKFFLVDAGGGNTILRNLEGTGLNINNLTDMFITHKHTDHLIGSVWIIRKAISNYARGISKNKITIYCNEEVKEIIYFMCTKMLHPYYTELFHEVLTFKLLEKENKFTILDNEYIIFNIDSKEVVQHGFRVEYEKDKYLTFLGDEPYKEASEKYVKGTNILIHEAFCMYKDREVFKPYEKHHATVKEASEIAQKYSIESLILVHTEDKNIQNRKTLYTKEAKEHYNGNIIIPDDLEKVEI